MRAAIVLILLVGCDAATLKKSGEACASSSECASGLLCQIEADTHAGTCQGTENTMDVDAAIDAFVLHLDGGSGSNPPPPKDAAIDAPIDAPPDTM